MGIGEHRDIEMLVPLDATPSAVFVALGDGVVPKAVVSAPGMEEADILELLNRDGLRYLHIERVRAGVILLDSRPHQGGDQSMTRGGATVRQGTMASPLVEPGSRLVATDAGREILATWLVRDERGAQMLFAVPYGLDSFEFADELAHAMAGRFTVHPVVAGVFSASEAVVAPEWNMVVSPAPEPAPGGLGARH